MPRPSPAPVVGRSGLGASGRWRAPASRARTAGRYLSFGEREEIALGVPSYGEPRRRSRGSDPRSRARGHRCRLRRFRWRVGRTRHRARRRCRLNRSHHRLRRRRTVRRQDRVRLPDHRPATPMHSQVCAPTAHLLQGLDGNSGRSEAPFPCCCRTVRPSRRYARLVTLPAYSLGHSATLTKDPLPLTNWSSTVIPSAAASRGPQNEPPSVVSR